MSWLSGTGWWPRAAGLAPIPGLWPICWKWCNKRKMLTDYLGFADCTRKKNSLRKNVEHATTRLFVDDCWFSCCNQYWCSHFWEALCISWTKSSRCVMADVCWRRFLWKPANDNFPARLFILQQLVPCDFKPDGVKASRVDEVPTTNPTTTLSHTPHHPQIPLRDVGPQYISYFSGGWNV